VAWSCQLYGLLVRAYSPGFRRCFGAEMVRVFGDCCAAAYQLDGLRGLAAAWGRALVDLAHNAPADRFQDLLHDPRSRRLLAALTPTALLLAALVGLADMSGAEVQGPVVLLLVFTGLLAFAHPGLTLAWAVLLGTAVPATHLLAAWRGWHLPYCTDAWTPVCALLALVPAFAGAFGGAWARRLLQPLRANLRTAALVVVAGALLSACVYQGGRMLSRETTHAAVCKQANDPWRSLVRSMDPSFFRFS
jgi:hypothetical protein